VIHGNSGRENIKNEREKGKENGCSVCWRKVPNPFWDA